MTSRLADRIEAHRNDLVEGFTKQYGVHTLVYFEVHDDMYHAIQREKRLKKWNRAWKITLIEETGSPPSRGRRLSAARQKKIGVGPRFFYSPWEVA